MLVASKATQANSQNPATERGKTERQPQPTYSADFAVEMHEKPLLNLNEEAG